MKRHAAHSTKGRKADRDKIDELITHDDPAAWSVARDLAIEKNIEDKIVLFDMARALDVSPADLEVTANRPYPESFEVSLGSQEYAVVPDEYAAYDIAIERVTEDLKENPEIFNQAFLREHIDQKALKKWVYAARLDDDYVDELAEHQIDDFWNLARRLDVDAAVPDTDEDGELMKPTRKATTAVKKAYAADYADSPMRYFEDMYSDEEALKAAIKAAGIDLKGAAQAAVSTDGWHHYLAHYDGNSATTDSGLVYWRTN